MSYIGIRGNQVMIVSDQKFGSKYDVVELPEELSNVSKEELFLKYRYTNGTFSSRDCKKSRKDIRLAIVGNWKMRCGISTYSENLWDAVTNDIGDFKLFIEDNVEPTSDLLVMGSKKLREDQVSSCWRRGESLVKLIAELKAYNPDIIWIQHEFGLWSNARYWLSMMSQLNSYRVIVTMHSTFHHQDKTIVEAAIPEIVVHLEGAKDLLEKEKCVPGKVKVIPHGSSGTVVKDKLWNFYRSNRTFMQFGFGFRYKGWENSIKAVAILKKKYNDVFFTGLFSESSFSALEHQVYYNELSELIENLDIKENVAILRGFQSDQTLDAYLRTNQVTVFPYVADRGHEVWGASGAARLAMSKGVPVISSKANHFSDLPTIKADGPEEIAEALDKLFGNWDSIKEQVEIQCRYMEQTSWAKVAEQYLTLFENPGK